MAKIKSVNGRFVWTEKSLCDKCGKNEYHISVYLDKADTTETLLRKECYNEWKCENGNN